MKTVDNCQSSSMCIELSEAEYLERTIERMVEELKAKNCLSQDFNFLTVGRQIESEESGTIKNEEKGRENGRNKKAAR